MPKRLVMVHHADGREDYICPKCDSVMVHATSGSRSFSAGVVDDDIREFLSCPNCGMDMDYPKMEPRDFKREELAF